MIPVNVLIAIIFMHFFADFVLQNDKMALNKSKSNLWLGIHVLVYMIPITVFGWKFSLINGVAHFITDWFTSRGTTYLWQKKKRHEFFVLIGLDQALHMATLVLVYTWLKG